MDTNLKAQTITEALIIRDLIQKRKARFKHKLNNLIVI